MAAALGPNGQLDLVDVQREMLDTVVRRARDVGVTNITCRESDAARLPYADCTFDGAYMIGALGEIPDGDGALRELYRVLKPNGRVVIGELFVDPDFISLRELQGRADQAGFVFGRKAGSPAAYLARFERSTPAEDRSPSIVVGPLLADRRAGLRTAVAAPTALPSAVRAH